MRKVEIGNDMGWPAAFATTVCGVSFALIDSVFIAFVIFVVARWWGVL
jgi:hypothetical protein